MKFTSSPAPRASPPSAALAVPASALAHRIGLHDHGQGRDATRAIRPVTGRTRPHYVVTNHGFTFVLREDNGDTDKGMINYKVLPGAYRNRAGLHAGRQAVRGRHGRPAARDVPRRPALERRSGDPRVAEGNDPFYEYVPFQATSAGLEDDPAKWLPVVLARTGIDLADGDRPGGGLRAASAAPTRRPTGSLTSARALNSGTIAQAVDPLEEQIGSLGTALAEARQAKAAARRAGRGRTRDARRAGQRACAVKLAPPFATSDGAEAARSRARASPCTGAPGARRHGCCCDPSAARRAGAEVAGSSRRRPRWSASTRRR